MAADFLVLFLKIVHFPDRYCAPHVINIEIVELDKLFLHEETVPKYITRLKKSILRNKVLSNPIIIDKNSYVVLDGTHRVQCFRELGYNYIVAALVDYSDPRVLLKNWYRVIRGRVNEIIRIAIWSGFSRTDIDPNNLYAEARDKIILLIDGETFAYSRGENIYGLYQKLREFEQMLGAHQVDIEYVHEEEALKTYEEGGIIVVTPSITKEDIIYYATRGLVFPPKTTRHIFPIRPMLIDFPVDLLVGDYDLPVINRILAEYLRPKQRVKIHGKTTIDRFYEEDYLIFFI